MDKYFSPLSGAITSIFLSFPNSIARARAAETAAPEEIPTKIYQLLPYCSFQG